MTLKTGLAAQFGIKAQADYDTPATVDRFYEFESESIDTDVGIIRVPQLGGGRFLRSDRRKAYIRGAKGSVSMVVMNKGFGLLLEHCIGQNTITGGSANKTHTIIPEANGLQGKALTVQVGRPDSAGTVQPFTFQGCKVTDWELKCAVDDALRLSATFDAKTVVTGTALATLSLPATIEPFIFTEGALTINGSTTFVKGASIKGSNGLFTDRRGLTNTKKEPLAVGSAGITGSLECEFESLTNYAAWVAGTVVANLVLTFTSATIIPTTAAPYSLTITIPAIAYNGKNPAVGGPDVVMQPLEFEALNNGTDPVITVAIVTSDTVS
jgi:hypothetical protein